jgi:hypothetical protein
MGNMLSCQLCVDESKALFDAVEARVDAVKAAGVVRQGRSVLSQRLLDLADPELEILDVVFRPLLPRANARNEHDYVLPERGVHLKDFVPHGGTGADSAQLVEDHVVRFFSHEDDSTRKRLRIREQFNYEMDVGVRL